MRIGLIIYGSLDTLTGGYIYDKILVDFLRSRGVVVKIFSQKYKNFFGVIQNNFSKKMLEDIIQFDPDILLQDQMNLVSLFMLNTKLKKIGNFPIISIVHFLNSKTKNNSLFRFITKKIEKRYFETVDGFIFNSHTMKESILPIIKKNKHALVAYPGKDRLYTHNHANNFFKRCYIDQFKIIFIGNLVYNKGLHILLHALSEIDKQLWELSVIGGLGFDTKYTQKILNQITCLKLGDNIRILGQLDRESLSRELTLHHVLAVPSYYESFGIVYAEAMGAGLPIIASNSGGVQEIVSHNQNGFLVTPGDVTMVKDAICKLIQNREVLLKMSLSSLSVYNKMPTWKESMELIYNFLSKYINN